MPWGWILCALLVPAGLILLALALFHVRVQASWGGTWESLDSSQGGSFQVEYGFPGFMRKWDGGRGTGDGVEPPTARPSHSKADGASHGLPSTKATTVHPDTPAPETNDAPQETAPSSPSSRILHAPTRKRRRSRRARRALFRFATDGKTWRLFARYAYATARGALRLLKPRLAVAVGHPDPVTLGRLAGYWHASAPFFSATPATLELRFQDRRPTLAVRAEGGFSALSLLLFAFGRVMAFPWIGLGRRAWHGWRGHDLEGWRKWTYRKLQD
jgi:hypothetical protein